MRKALLTIILCVIGLTSCDIESPYSGYAAYFSFDATFAPFNQIYSAGQFITIRKKSVTSYEVTDIYGSKQIQQLTEAQARQHFQYGFGGFIIGTPIQGGDIIVYDWACPNCDLSPNRLQIMELGYAKCNSCNCEFDLSQKGYAIKGESRPLWLYHNYSMGSEITIRN